MNPTLYAAVNPVLATLQSEMHHTLGRKLIGLYVYGSLVTGDFDLALSDLDLAAVLATDLAADEFARLGQMHAAIGRDYPAWEDRIEVGYISVANLRPFDPRCTIAVISPGEPFHLRVAEHGWVFNLHVLREQSLTLFGPVPTTLIDPISQEQLAHALRERMIEWRAWTDDHEPIVRRKDQAYAILTMCHALYAHRHGAFVSKREAAFWAMGEQPEWASLITDALRWRAAPDDEHVDHHATQAEALRFTRAITGIIIDDA
ncbi:MAG: DUF4111 domain-containing protein [Chloroflexota bacterium]|nr:DUF4111 domain-containing protein [Chloroflexota bacterium]MDP9472720.1 DUF4111 domain-containing protein [Chloroflexota bacterium]